MHYALDFRSWMARPKVDLEGVLGACMNHTGWHKNRDYAGDFRLVHEFRGKP